MATTDNILVAVKSRPFINREKSAKLKPQWVVQDKENVIIQIDEDGRRIGEPYAFDHIFPETSTNEDVYNTIVKPLVSSSLQGFNSTIFTYGQTSSGKTHTMLGNSTNLGIIQLAVRDIFTYIEDSREREFLITASYYEIYKEKINDLLDKNGKDLKIREDLHGNTFVTSKQEVVTQIADVFDLMKVGNKIKKIGCTNMNEKSSRSHTIFRITIESRDSNVQGGPVQISQLNLVDLAGSERIAHTNVTGTRLDEGITINKSLSALGNVIRQLSDGEGFISYRDSKLTRLLQQALGGNAKSLIIATITLAVADETKSTLEFAQRAKIIKNKPIVNEILTEQDKAKQYESLATDYKQRLEIQLKQVELMANEKSEQEKQILKLQETLKLINLFAKGTIRDTRSQSKIPRRHTVGHYSSHRALDLIPEMSAVSGSGDIESPSSSKDRALPSTSRDSEPYSLQKLDSSFEEDRDSGEEAFGESHDTSTTMVEAVADQPSPTTIRVRLRHLEQSYASLQEFTRLEVKCQDKSLVESLKKEKEALMKDLTDYNIIILEERKEAQAIRMQHENEIELLKRELERQKKLNEESGFSLCQAKSEMNMLKDMKAQESQDYVFLLEQQKGNYEKKLTELRDKNAELQKELEDDERKWWEGLQEELNVYKAQNVELRESNRDLQESSERRISELEKEVESVRLALRREEANILSKLYTLKDILEANNDVQNNIDERREKQVLQDELKELKNKYNYVQEENAGLQSMVEELKQNVYDLKTKNCEFQAEIQEREEVRQDLAKSVEKATEENGQLLQDIEKNNNEKIALEKKISEQEDSIRKLSETNIALKEKLSRTQHRNDEISKELDQYKVDNSEALRQNLLKQKCIDQKDDHIAKLSEEIKSLANERDTMKKKISELDYERNNIEGECIRVEQDLQDANEELIRLKEYNSELTHSLNLLKEKQSKVVGEVEDSTQKLKDTTSMASGDESLLIATHDKRLLDKLSTLNAENLQLKDKLNTLKSGTDLETTNLVSRIKELENGIANFKKRVAAVYNLVSPVELESTLSMKEVRRKKRQSLHDQRRGINFNDYGTVKGDISIELPASDSAESNDTDIMLTKLEAEVRHLISSREEGSKQEIEELKAKLEHCGDCKIKNIRIKHLEDELRKNMLQIVSQETTIFDIQKTYKMEKEELKEKCDYLQHHLSILKKEIEARNSIKKIDREVQCDLMKKVWQTEETKALKKQMEQLTSRNTFLDSEIKTLTDNLVDEKKCVQEQKKDIKKLKREIENLKARDIKCQVCEVKQKRISELENFAQKTTYKLATMQTTIFDLRSSKQVEKDAYEDRIVSMQRRTDDLEKKIQQLVDSTRPKEMKTVGVGCDIMDYQRIAAKYQQVKRLAILRRDECNELKRRLGIRPDEPVQ